MKNKWTMFRLVILIVAFLILLFCVSVQSKADENVEVYVICQPDSFVYIRERPKFNAEPIAYVNVGEELTTDGKKDGKWLHVYYLCEAGEGWIYGGYVTNSEPEIYEDGIEAHTKYKEVFSRRNVNGKKSKTMKKGTKVTAYVVSDEWTITNAGFIKTKYLSFEGEEDDG